MGVNYGLNKVRFTAPVPAGAKIRGRFTLAKFDKLDDGGVQTTWNVTVERQGEDKPAMVAETISRHYF
jgi:acyl dehydratase